MADSVKRYVECNRKYKHVVPDHPLVRFPAGTHIVFSMHGEMIKVEGEGLYEGRDIGLLWDKSVDRYYFDDTPPRDTVKMGRPVKHQTTFRNNRSNRGSR